MKLFPILNRNATITSSSDEFRLYAKKVELTAFTGDDLVAWITRAKTYFEGSGARYKPRHGSWIKSQKPNWAFHEGEGNGSVIQTQTNNYLGKTCTGSGYGYQTGSTSFSRPNLSDNSHRQSCGVRHLPSAEVNECRAKGLCFRCNERWDPLHQCATKQLQLIILGDDEIVNDEGEIGVNLGDDHRVLTRGRWNGIQMSVGVVKISFDAYVLELGGVDLILGVVWLKALGKVTMDWKEMFMVFNHKSSMVKLLGQVVDDKTATFQSIITPSRMIAGCEYPTLMEVLGSQVSRVSDQQTKELEGLLEHFVIVFKEIQGLPPPRNTSHSIELLQGTGLESVRP
ncbi:hypothetical protein KIW84_034572 [Lathyrus oleraceus]|uniref:Uncharacterized protein n=1 Tax=Pisum sativum TaxID=3888 RepID=A0A9D5B5D7_PEA|nr:hypothetical protein KIW84_034572 [Pisum sativum]